MTGQLRLSKKFFDPLRHDSVEEALQERFFIKREEWEVFAVPKMPLRLFDEAFRMRKE